METKNYTPNPNSPAAPFLAKMKADMEKMKKEMGSMPSMADMKKEMGSMPSMADMKKEMGF